MGDERKMIIEVVGKEIEKIKGDFESYLNGLNMVGEISYSQYSELYDEGTKQIQRAYELGKSEIKKENTNLKALKKYEVNVAQLEIEKLENENAKLKRIVRMVAMINKDVYTEEGIKAIYAEAEQFLNSEVEK